MQMIGHCYHLKNFLPWIQIIFFSSLDEKVEDYIESINDYNAIFSSMKNYIELDCPAIDNELFHEVPNFEIKQYEPRSNSIVWAVDMIITDNEAESVKNALNQLGHDVSIKRQTHWEISLDKNHDKAIPNLNHIDESNKLTEKEKRYKL